MKNKFLVLLGLAGMVALGGCQETKEDSPILIGHEGEKTANFLNEPAMKDQYLMIDESNRDGKFLLTCSQPEYGYAAIVTYNVQVSLTEDFTDYIEISQSFYNCANITPANADVAAAMEKLADIKSEADLPMDYRPVYMRLHAFIAESPDNTQYLSNVVVFEHIGANYLAIWISDQPSGIFLRGGMNNWGNGAGDLDGWEFVTGPSDYTWVTPNEVTIAAGTEFKVADSAWREINLGGPGGATTQVDFNKKFQLTNDSGSGNLIINKDFKGTVQLRLEQGNYFLILADSNYTEDK